MGRSVFVGTMALGSVERMLLLRTVGAAASLPNRSQIVDDGPQAGFGSNATQDRDMDTATIGICFGTL